MIKFVKDWISDNVPESVQFAVGLIVLLLTPAFLIYFGSHYEWVSSITFFTMGLVIAVTNLKNFILKNKWYAVGFVLIFSFIGLAWDGAGNRIYNKPLEKFCPAETELIREVVFVKGYNYDDNDSYIQKFSCFSKTENRIVEVISRWKILGIRFLEYLILSLGFLGIYWSLSKLKSPKKI